MKGADGGREPTNFVLSAKLNDIIMMIIILFHALKYCDIATLKILRIKNSSVKF